MRTAFSAWLRYFSAMGLREWFRRAKRVGLGTWFRYMRSCMPPARVETYGAVTIYDYCDYKKAVIDGDSYDDFYIPHDIKVDSVVLVRSFKPHVAATIFLPFDIPAQRIHGAVLRRMGSAYSSGGSAHIRLAPPDAYVSAYVPYVVQSTDTALVFDGPVTLKKTVHAEVRIGDSDFYARSVYSMLRFGDHPELLGRSYGIAGVSDAEGNLVKAGPTAWIPPMRMYVYDSAS